jgi:SnoaL-like polyketide cyclase
VVRRLCEAMTKGELDTLRELLAGSCSPPISSTITCAPDNRTTARARKLHPGSRRGSCIAYSGLRYLVVEQMAAEGDRLVSRLSLRGTHDRAQSKGFAPTGKVDEDTAIVINRIVGGRIVEGWGGGASFYGQPSMVSLLGSANLQNSHLTLMFFP